MRATIVVPKRANPRSHGRDQATVRRVTLQIKGIRMPCPRSDGGIFIAQSGSRVSIQMKTPDAGGASGVLRLHPVATHALRPPTAKDLLIRGIATMTWEQHWERKPRPHAAARSGWSKETGLETPVGFAVPPKD